MKTRAMILSVISGMAGLVLVSCGEAEVSGGVASPETLKTQLEEAHKAKDIKKMAELYCWAGVDAAKKDKILNAVKNNFFTSQLKDITIKAYSKEVADIENKPLGSLHPNGKILGLIGFNTITSNNIPKISIKHYGTRDSKYFIILHVKK